MKRSRISSKFKRKSQKTLILSILGFVILLALIFKFGIPFIVTVGNLFEHTSKKTNLASQEKFISVPSLDELPNATSKQDLKISGTSSPETIVELFINGSKEGEVKPSEDGTFSFNITLSDGDNIIKTRAKINESTSDFSDSQNVQYKNSPPNLSIDSPSDGSSVNSETIIVSGKTDEGVRVTVNDFWAVLNPDNTYSYTLKLNQGGNKILVVATDEAGNKSEKEINVTYSP